MISDCIRTNLQVQLLPCEGKGAFGKERTSVQPILVLPSPSLTSLYIEEKSAVRKFLVFCLFSFKINQKDIKESLRFTVFQVDVSNICRITSIPNKDDTLLKLFEKKILI